MTRADTTDLANEVRIACQRVSRRVRFESGGELAPHHVSALSTLKHGPKTPSELAEAERVSAPSMTKTVGCLVERGLVASADNPADGRSKLLSLRSHAQTGSRLRWRPCAGPATTGWHASSKD